MREEGAMDLGIEGRRAAVAGASAGLGLAAARALAAEGAMVTICSRHRDRVEAAAASISPDVVPVVADVGTIDGASGFVDQAIDAMGGVDVLVANAGGPPPGTFATTDADDFVPALEVNLLSIVAMCKRAVPPMQQRKWGRVVAITSIAVRQPIAELILSNTARAGVTGFLKSLALEVAADGVTVNSVQPGLHETDRLRALHGGDPAALAASIPTRTIGQPDDFGAVVAFLCSQHAAFVTGAAIPVDGGTYRGLL
jgi:3-oxoacyl-[acyl-carrier protein] reductase